MNCPSCGNPCRRLDAGVVARGHDGGAIALDRALHLLDGLANDRVSRLAVADVAGVLRSRVRCGDAGGDITVIERVWECTECDSGPVRIERETRIVEDLGPTRRRSVPGKRDRWPDHRRGCGSPNRESKP